MFAACSKRSFTAVMRPSASLQRFAPLSRSLHADAVENPSEPASSSTASEAEVAKKDKPFTEKWYHVARSASGEIPVYSKYKNGGHATTLVRKIQGDVGTLKYQLNTFFESNHLDPFTNPPRATIRPASNQLQIKGHWVEEVRDFLKEKGF